MNNRFEVVGSYRMEFETGLVAGIAANSIMLSVRHADPVFTSRLRSLEVECLTTVAFTAAQEVGWKAFIARAYTVSPTGQTQITPGSSGKRRTDYPNTAFGAGTGDMRVSAAGAITAGTATVDSQPIAAGTFWSSAVGAQFAWRRQDFNEQEPAGFYIQTNEGIIIQNAIALGAGGSVRFRFSLSWDDGLLSSP